MNNLAEQWDQIEKLVEANPDLSSEQLLQKMQSMDSSFNQVELIHESVDAQVDALIGHVFSGPKNRKASHQSEYIVQDLISEGGQSEIYRATRADGLYQKTVAIKYLKTQINQEHAKSQFLQEMQILARLRHPHVVPILDAGYAHNNQPWIVLEYIEGKPLDAYCAENALTANQILRLVLKVCDALQYIHEMGIVHMDVKPTNILVEMHGDVMSPVLLDFGISTLMDEQDEAPTQFVYGTPGYMPPEQINQVNIDPRVDVFATGAILYQLLNKTDLHKPLQNNSISDVFFKDTAFRSLVSDDLYCVIQKCLQPEAGNRYQDISELKLDIENILNGYPIREKNDRLAYVLGKSFLRHKKWYLTFMFLFFIGAAFAWNYTVTLKQQKENAEQSRNMANGILSFLLEELYQNLDEIGKTALMRDISEQSLEYLTQYDGDQDDLDYHLQSANALIQVSRVLLDLQLVTEAESALNNVSGHLQRLDLDPMYHQHYLTGMFKLNTYLGEVHQLKSNSEKQQQHLNQALAWAEKAKLRDSTISDHPTWTSLNLLSWYHIENNNAELAVEFIQKSIDLAKKNLDTTVDKKADWAKYLSQSYQAKAWYELDYGEPTLAVKEAQSAVEFSQAALQHQPLRIDLQNNYRILLNQLAFLHLELSEQDTAEPLLVNAVEAGEAMDARSPENNKFKRELAYSYHLLTGIYLDKGALESATQLHPKSLTISEYLSDIDPDNDSAKNDYAIDLMMSGNIAQMSNQNDRANQQWQKAISIMQPIVEKPNSSIYYLNTYVTALLKMGDKTTAKPFIEKILQQDFHDAELNKLLTQHGFLNPE